jgi:hypothetical protein
LSLVSNSALVLVYIGVLVIGLALIGGAIVSLLRSFTPGQQSQPGGKAGSGLSRVTTYSLGLGAAVFGAVGLIAHFVFQADPATGVIWSLGIGLLAGFIALALFFYRPSRSGVEEAILDFDAAGRRAEVIIAIPSNGLGEIAFHNGGERINLGARSATGRPIGRGALVVIERVSNHIAVVSPLAERDRPAGSAGWRRD